MAEEKKPEADKNAPKKGSRSKKNESKNFFKTGSKSSDGRYGGRNSK